MTAAILIVTATVWLLLCLSALALCGAAGSPTPETETVRPSVSGDGEQAGAA